VCSELRLDVAGICVALHVQDLLLEDQVRQRYGPFLTDQAEPRATISVIVQEGAEFSPEPVTGAPAGALPVRVDYNHGGFRFESLHEKGFLDLGTGLGRLVLSRSPDGNPENFLRAVYARLSLLSGKLLLHAASVAREDEGFVFFGNSGSGKTTVANLSLEHTVLSDDLSIVSATQSECRVHGLPFRGASFRWPVVNMDVPLRGAYRLRKDREHRLEPLAPAQAMAELMACAPFMAGHADNYDRAMEIVSRVLSLVPVQDLYFRRDKGFWGVVADA
jgi:hypothetical protein